MKHPTHAVRYINNWDGQEDIDTILAIKESGMFYSYDTNKILLEYEGDKILYSWALDVNNCEENKRDDGSGESDYSD